MKTLLDREYHGSENVFYLVEDALYFVEDIEDAIAHSDIPKEWKGTLKVVVTYTEPGEPCIYCKSEHDEWLACPEYKAKSEERVYW